MKNKDFFRSIHAPYYIYGLDYRHSSAGIRLLHQLCHALNEIGQEAYIYCSIVNPELRTPRLTEEVRQNHTQAGRKPIAVYPEVVIGNPFNLFTVVRYILNFPGHLGGDPHYEDSEMLFSCSRYFFRKGMKIDVLMIPPIDIKVFNNIDNPYENSRQGTCFYAHKYLSKGFQLTSEANGAIDLGQSNLLTPQEIAAILRKSELLYCYEPSNIATEAMLCGCPVVFVPTDYLKEYPMEFDFHDGSAFGISPESIANAKATVSHVFNRYLKVIDDAWEQLDYFVELTQTAAKQSLYSATENNEFSQIGSITSETTSNQGNDYWKWIARHHFSSETLKRFLENSPNQTGISLHLFVLDDNGDNQALVLTQESLEEQIVNNWQLTILSSASCPNSLPKQISLNWIEITETDLSLTLSNAVANSTAEWFMVGVLGVRIDSAFTALINTIGPRHPEWRFVYCDEDVIGRNARPRDPLLKPDANLDLLRSTCYVGNACLIHRELWNAIPPEELKPGLLLNYAAALRCYELFGEQAVGHIDDIVVHQPHTLVDDLDQFEQFGLELLRNHLWRQGIPAEANLGLVKGSFFIDYPLFYSPLVSIIIPNKNLVDLLKPCISSLLEKTRHSSYEIIVVDNCSDDPATLDYLAYLPLLDRRIKIIPYPQRFNYSAMNNLAVQQAQGDFLLFLNNDTVILQENWLERLLSIGIRDDVGAVGCRLIHPNQTIQHAGIILGLGSVGGHIGFGSPMTDPGYMGRAQLMQNFSAVTAACMLVRKDLFLKVGGLDQKDFPILYNDIDLCLKIREQGYRIVWTPFVNLIHYGNSSLDANPDSQRDEQNSRSRRAFIKKWFTVLGHDPAYNRHLSLRHSEWMIDNEFDVIWHPDLEPLPRIVAQPPDEMGVGQYRMIGPLKALTDSHRVCSFLLPPLNTDKHFLPFVSELARVKPTVLFLQNAFTAIHIDDLQHYIKLLPDVFRVFGQDDIVFSIPQKSIARKHFGKDTKARVRKAVSLCHRAIVTTEPIAEAMRGMVDDIRVMPNYLERPRWGNLQPPRKERRKLRVGWAGAQQHQGDLEFILPVVEATANEVDWVFMGMCLAKLRYHIAELYNPVPFEHYPAALAELDLDLAIAPLEINRFNTAKSNLRLLEYGAVGYPVICTDIEPYRNAPVTCVPNNPKAWIDAIRAHIHDMDATRAAGERLHDWVLSNWMLDQHLDEWMKILLPD